MNRLYKFLFVALLLSQFSNAQSSGVSLFNGNDLKGWYAFEPKSGKHTDASELFSVEDQMIRLYGKKTGYLMSEKSYRNFKLTVEFKWNIDSTFTRKSDKPNSGVMYLIPADSPDMLWPKGIQFQIKKDATGDFILLNEVTLEIKGEKTVPGKSVVANRFKDAANSIGEWNTIVITSKNGKIKQQLNGKLVNKGKKSSVQEGRILLQYEGFPIDFRKVEIKTLK
ncbi:DUF1080 domain-containing protein [Lutibacter sp. HS1-25]|uniref:3-keto-disaccharide hydrolase n=1 Tax=Lutibacter sp. HS1-25 TaxID=2485000 RepID=UPI0010106E78|nr:DUF1080 domain-containing protein [Lutibacter sp. HS1-25]RXP64536.1 DUF1080 domain-containing protein [Lutibacter sp. HS1-25]